MLHRYAHIAIMMREAKAATFKDWLGAFWAWDPQEVLCDSGNGALSR